MTTNKPTDTADFGDPTAGGGDHLIAPVAGSTNYTAPSGDKNPSFDAAPLPEDEALPPKSERIDVEALKNALDGKWAKYRQQGRDMAADPRFARPYGMDTASQRELTMARVKHLADLKWPHGMLPEKFGGQNIPGGNVVRFGEFVNGDPSTQIKAGVQWGLFGSAILNLGSEEHLEKWMPSVADLSLPGAFAMTEIGHGSDVASVATRATYDPDTEEFVINTPFRAATKEFLGNAANDGQAAVVFAGLVTKGVDHGVHVFFVPIRDKEGNPLPGITIEDDGVKGGLNGIDNGRIAFDHVRVPRFNMLNRFGEVAADGTYSSDIESPGRRFFTMISTLVQGRVMLTDAGCAASKLGLGIAINYAVQRKQFPHPDDPNRQFTIMDYGLHKRRLLPKLAETVALAFAEQDLIEAFDEIFSGRSDNDEDRSALETLAAGLKPRSTWLALDVLQEAREALGGSGFMATNHIAPLRQDIDIFATFEGDNNILTQLVSKRLLSEYADNFKDPGVGSIANMMLSRVDTLASRHTPLRRLAQAATDFGSTRRAANNLQDEDLQVELFTKRVEKMVEEVAHRIRTAPEETRNTDVMETIQADMIDMAKASVDLDLLLAFNKGLESISDPNTVEVVTYMRDLYALSTIEKNLGWYLVNGLISLNRGRTISGYVNRLLEKIRPHATDIVAAFGYDQRHWRATVLDGSEARRQEEEAAWYEAERQRGEEPKSEKAMYKARKAEQRKAAKKK